MDLGIEGKVAIVTGGETAIGRACVAALAAEGAGVCLLRTAGSTSDEAGAPAGKTGAETMAVDADLSTEDGCRRAVDACIARFGAANILVNISAGAQTAAPVLELTGFELEQALAPRLFPYLRLSQLVAPHMQAAGWGRIVNVLDGASVDPTDEAMPGGFAAMAVLNLTKALSDELAPHGVLVNAVTVDPETAGAASGAEEVARAVCFLSSEACSYVFASVLNVGQ